jgi:FAD/FMN-containing dehydrogenase
MTNFAERQLAGWGRFPTQNCHVARPEKQRELFAAVADSQVQTLVARGLGRAYGDAALNLDSGVLLCEKMGAFLDFNEQTGVLHAQGGASFADILETFVPRGYFLPVAPGTKFITLGGAIACNVHGKNHHIDGSISEFIEEIELLTAAGDILTLSRHDLAEEFWATLGGMGLTGVILSAKLRLMPIETAYLRVSTTRTQNLDQTLDQFKREGEFRYSVAWLDCLASGENLGRSVLIRGDHAAPDEIVGEPLDFSPPRKRGVPLDFPDFVLNPASVTAFNSVYYASHPDGEKIMPFEPFFWPLDAVSGWNRIYGGRGFIQYQCVLPHETSRDGLKTLLETIATSGRAPFLAVLKVLGQADASPLGFPLAGHALSLDLAASEGVVEFAQSLDKIVLEFGGRNYLAKDATLTASTMRQMYPRLGDFERVKARLDPNGRFSSSLSRRLEIGGAR